jgi:4-hydroxythreonine-4-phosphate dehydrogenase
MLTPSASFAITMGDPCGIGPEICVKLFALGVKVPAVVIGDRDVLRRTVASLGLQMQVNDVAGPVDAKGSLPVLSLTQLAPDLPIGQVDAHAGKAAYDYLVKAIEMAMAGAVTGIVTAPISKEAMKKAGIDFPGHTEILAEKSGSRDFAMMLANEDLRVVLVSIHVSLLEAIRLVTQERVLKTIRLASKACMAFGISRPRVAVAGLNPHAGEAGMFGDEDAREIVPAIAAARAEGIDATGPWPPDTIFMRARRGAYDVVVAQYHDQGLIPVKYMGLEKGVNVTVGLPFIRTSVDHGTAFDIAGKGQADHRSLRHALDQAVALAAVAHKSSRL